ncbi:ADP-ribosyltransferase [Xanthobacter flavus]|uniref:ADP-ribosyltransferase n=1 Tax=Xanthobacter flavus TaxID=281 RepID=UPI003729CC0F
MRTDLADWIFEDRLLEYTLFPLDENKSGQIMINEFSSLPIVARGKQFVFFRIFYFFPGLGSGANEQEHASIVNYAWRSYYEINTFLNGNNNLCSPESSYDIYNLDTALSRAIFNGASILYRAEQNYEYANKLLEGLDEGEEFVIPSYWSTSRSADFVLERRGSGLIWAISVAPSSEAVDIQWEAPFQNEQEVLWNRGSRFVVLKVDLEERIITVRSIKK